MVLLDRHPDAGPLADSAGPGDRRIRHGVRDRLVLPSLARPTRRVDEELALEPVPRGDDHRRDALLHARAPGGAPGQSQERFRVSVRRGRVGVGLRPHGRGAALPVELLRRAALHRGFVVLGVSRPPARRRRAAGMGRSLALHWSIKYPFDHRRELRDPVRELSPARAPDFHRPALERPPRASRRLSPPRASRRRRFPSTACNAVASSGESSRNSAPIPPSPASISRCARRAARGARAQRRRQVHGDSAVARTHRGGRGRRAHVRRLAAGYREPAQSRRDDAGRRARRRSCAYTSSSRSPRVTTPIRCRSRRRWQSRASRRSPTLLRQALGRTEATGAVRARRSAAARASLFLDEPTVGLDVQAREALWSSVRRLLADGCSVVLTTHYLEEAEALATRVAVLAKGRLIACGSVADMRGAGRAAPDPLRSPR